MVYLVYTCGDNPTCVIDIPRRSIEIKPISLKLISSYPWNVCNVISTSFKIHHAVGIYELRSHHDEHDFYELNKVFLTIGKLVALERSSTEDPRRWYFP